LAGGDQPVGRSHGAQADPLLVIRILPMQQDQQRVVHGRVNSVAGRQVQLELERLGEKIKAGLQAQHFPLRILAGGRGR